MLDRILKCRRGVTYLEIIVAMAVLGIVLTSLIKIISYSSRFDYGNEEMTRMAIDAQSVMELSLSKSPSQPLSPIDPNDLNAYNNCSVSTPDIVNISIPNNPPFTISTIDVTVKSQESQESQSDKPGVSSPYDLLSYKLTFP